MTAVSIAPVWLDDDLCYSEFYQRYHRPLTCYLQMGFRDADVEAVAQETFCRALAHWSEVRNMSAPWPWLAVTARNLARNNIRDERASQPTGLDVFHPATRSREDVAEQVEASESLRRLAQAMSVLTPLQKRLVTVMVEEGLTGAQLARRLDMRPGAVRMHLCRMRLRLGERFASLGGVLGIGPLALFPAMLRRLTRPRRYGAPQAALTAGSTAVAFSLAVVAIGGAVLGLLPETPARAGGAPVSRPVLSASVHRSVAAPPVSQRTSSEPAQRAGQQPQQAPAATYRLTVSKTPTGPGKTADAGIDVATPVGTVHVGVLAKQRAPDPGNPCLVVGC